MKKLVLVCLLILGVVFGTSCKGSTTPEPPPVKHPPVIINFTVEPQDCLCKEVVAPVLGWATTGATSVSIDHGIGMVTASGTKLLAPVNTTTRWTLTATNSDGTVEGACTFTVKPCAHFILVSSQRDCVGIYDGHGYMWQPKIAGVVRNDGFATGHGVMVEFAVLTIDGSSLQAFGYPADGGNIAPGQSIGFEAVFKGVFAQSCENALAAIAGYTYRITWLEGTL